MSGFQRILDILVIKCYSINGVYFSFVQIFSMSYTILTRLLGLELEHSFLGLVRCRSPRCYGERSELRAFAPRCNHRFSSPQSAARQSRIPHSPAQIRKSQVSQAGAIQNNICLLFDYICFKQYCCQPSFSNIMHLYSYY